MAPFRTMPATYDLDLAAVPWVPAAPGVSFKPIHFLPGNAGWIQLLRLEPGATIPLHRHTGPVHAINVAGTRHLLHTGARVGPWQAVHESDGDVDAWRAAGPDDCIVHVTVHGTVEYLAPDGSVDVVVDAALQRQLYLDHCAAVGLDPHPALARDHGAAA